MLLNRFSLHGNLIRPTATSARQKYGIRFKTNFLPIRWNISCVRPRNDSLRCTRGSKKTPTGTHTHTRKCYPRPPQTFADRVSQQQRYEKRTFYAHKDTSLSFTSTGTILRVSKRRNAPQVPPLHPRARKPAKRQKPHRLQTLRGHRTECLRHSLDRLAVLTSTRILHLSLSLSHSSSVMSR